MYLMRERKCGFCGKEIKEGEEVYQIETDVDTVGFVYIHKECMDKKKPDMVTYRY